jgi:hypothetical protein
MRAPSGTTFSLIREIGHQTFGRSGTALEAATRRAQAVVPLFVLDDRPIPLSAPNGCGS